MTDAEMQATVQAVADAVAADAQAALDAAKAKRAALFAKVRTYVVTHAATLAVGAGAAFVVLKVL